MSRLAGRITFPGAQQAEKDSHPTPSSSSSSSTEPEWRNQRNNPRRPQRSEETSEKSSEIKPRGKGNVRYQGNYSQDRLRNEKSEKTWNTERFERQEKPERFGKNERFERSERPRKPTEKIENVMPTEELLEVEDIIAQISDLSIRNDRSAAQIKRNILGSADLIDTMDEDDWQKVCESMMKTALEEGEPEFISDLMVAIFKNETFSAVMSDELMAASSAHIMEEDEKPLPALLSAILCAHWPRQYAKAFDNINPILYTIVCIVKGWILVVNEDTERFYKAEKKPKYQVRRDLEEEEEEEVKSPESEEKIIEDPAIVNKCALGLSDLCDTAQRQLWVNWMSLTDEIYECIKPAITHNPNIEGSVKTRLLDTFIQMNQWTKTRQTSVRHSSVQTVRE